MAAIDDVLNGIKDDSVKAAKEQLQSLLQQAKTDSRELPRRTPLCSRSGWFSCGRAS